MWQRQTVRTLLARDPRVAAFGDAPPGQGGWGATWITLLGSTQLDDDSPGERE